MNLSHIRALVTRPEPQARALTEAIRESNGQAWSMPMLDIDALAETQAMRDCLLMLDQFDRVIVTSRPAARLGVELIERYWPQLPMHCQWFAIGSSTAAELEQFAIKAQYSQTGEDSEALLALDAFNHVQDKKVLIIKGVGGREVLEQHLGNCGARVDTLVVYQRACPSYERNAVVKKLESHSINVILCGSGETLTNLGYYLPMSYRADYRLLVPSERVARQARSLGFQQVTNTGGASNEMMLQALARICLF
ncbi:uroporphyrinogen-III synthase [Endozoicomonas sp. SCSIO W0465]|uniref:uroporphyrinogen-III synthase n=1 Tax=Endozoicomonas sp. SCSIO W0465 TaxID=2918516 RepID=UPI0020750E73|nr:uroporphyrinogen-III synthase [Endozoicomonas sp. SCSIO W0465]USE36536.1 uroporphyrinogen-III synthase [Endozoicomonas sp. SCSIO W0465]